MTTTMTTDQRERIILLEQRQQLRQIIEDHYGRVQSELTRLHEDQVRCEALFADRTELPVIGSFRDVLAAMAARWRAAAETARQEYEADTEAALDNCAGELEALLADTEAGEPR